MSPGSKEQLLEEKIARLVSELDDLVALAADPSTSSLIFDQALAIGQIYSRSALLKSFLISAQVPMLKVVKNG